MRQNPAFQICRLFIKFENKMKKTVKTIIILLLYSHLAVAQKEANIWYFGANSGLDFNNGSPQVLNNGQLVQPEGCSTISDANGNLLLYTQGTVIWNNNHQILSNGTGLLGGSSSSQSALIVPRPGSSTNYYVFTTPEVSSTITGLHYSEVDLTLSLGAGAINTNYNVQLMTPTAEKLTAVHHSNNIDIWVISHEANSDAFYSYMITSSGVISTPVISNVGVSITNSNGRVGQLKASPNGEYLAVAYWDNMNTAQLLNFDNNTGVVSNPITLSSSYPFNGPYGVEFSPLSQFVYISATDSFIYQYDINAINIPLSETTLIWPLGLTPNGQGLQLAPDGKIYGASYLTPFLKVINNPDLSGIACGLTTAPFNLSPGDSRFSLPGFVQSYFYKPNISHLDTCFGDTASFYTELVNYDSLSWDFGDPPSGVLNFSTLIAPQHYYSTPSTYTVQLIVYRNSIPDTSYEDITIYPLTDATITGIGALCFNDNLINLSAVDVGGVWSGNGITNTATGEFDPAIAGVGVHQIIYTTPGNCGDSDTIQVQVNPIFNNTTTLTICQGDSLFIYGLWQNSAGFYYDSLNTLLGCDSLMITELKVDSSYLINDTITICQGDSSFLQGQFQVVSGSYIDNFSTVLGCDSIIQTQLYVISTPLAPLVNDTSICFNDGIPSLVAQNQGTGITEWYSDPQLINLLTTGIFYTPQISVAGIYTYYIVENNNGCYGDTTSITLTVYKPEAIFTVSPSSGFSPLEVTFTNNSNNATIYLWNFATGDTSTLYDTLYTYNEPGTYNVSLAVEDVNGCSDTMMISLDVLTEALIITPNVFSPNNDGFNDIFSIDAKGVKELSGTIFNRWGQKVWDLFNLKEIQKITLHNYPIWDGRTTTGAEVPEGVYYYILEYTSLNDEPGIKKGTITLLR
jgi:gliding motility-associated-like protein